MPDRGLTQREVTFASFLVALLAIVLSVFVLIAVGAATDAEKKLSAWTLLVAFVSCTLALAFTQFAARLAPANYKNLAGAGIWLVALVWTTVAIWIFVSWWNRSCDSMNVMGHLCTALQAVSWVSFIGLVTVAAALVRKAYASCSGSPSNNQQDVENPPPPELSPPPASNGISSGRNVATCERADTLAELETFLSGAASKTAFVLFTDMRNHQFGNFAKRFAMISNSIPGVANVQVDIDKNKRAARMYCIHEAPAVRVYKNGAKVDEIVGNDLHKLDDLFERCRPRSSLYESLLAQKEGLDKDIEKLREEKLRKTQALPNGQLAQSPDLRSGAMYIPPLPAQFPPEHDLAPHLGRAPAQPEARPVDRGSQQAASVADPARDPAPAPWMKPYVPPEHDLAPHLGRSGDAPPPVHGVGERSAK